MSRDLDDFGRRLAKAIDDILLELMESSSRERCDYSASDVKEKVENTLKCFEVEAESKGDSLLARHCRYSITRTTLLAQTELGCDSCVLLNAWEELVEAKRILDEAGGILKDVNVHCDRYESAYEMGLAAMIVLTNLWERGQYGTARVFLNRVEGVVNVLEQAKQSHIRQLASEFRRWFTRVKRGTS